MPNDAETWHRSAEWLRPGVRTVFEMVNDHVPQGDSPRTASVDEAIDRGADYGTMALLRAAGGFEAATNGMGDLLPDPAESPFVQRPEHLEDAYFRWGVQVDDLGLQQVLQLWETADDAPTLTWWANVVTDAGHHGGGPRSEHGPRLAAPERRPAGGVPRPPRGARGARRGDLPADGRPRVRGRPTRA